MKRVLAIVGVLLLVAVAVLTDIYRRYNLESAELTPTVRAGAGGSYVALPLPRVAGNAATIATPRTATTHYEIAGPAEAQTVLLVHGFSVPYYIWDPMFTGLVGAGFRVRRFDLYGRGYSDRPDAHYDPDLFDSQIVGLLAALGINGPVDIAGLSMGGPIATTFAVRHPEKVRSLLLFDTLVADTEPSLSLRLPVVGEFVADVFLLPNLTESQVADLAHPERIPDWSVRFRPQTKYKGFRRAILSTIRYYEPADHRVAYTEYGRSGKPVLLVWGREDKTLPFAENGTFVRQAIPQAEFQVIDDVGHVPFLEKPEIVVPLTIEFLRRRTSSAGAAVAAHPVTPACKCV